jgi:hypothetical protein
MCQRQHVHVFGCVTQDFPHCLHLGGTWLFCLVLLRIIVVAALCVLSLVVPALSLAPAVCKR